MRAVQTLLIYTLVLTFPLLPASTTYAESPTPEKILHGAAQAQADGYVYLHLAAREQGERFSKAAFESYLDQSRALWSVAEGNQEVWNNVHRAVLAEGEGLAYGNRVAQEQQIRMLWTMSQMESNAWWNIHRAMTDQGKRFSYALLEAQFTQTRMLWNIAQGQTHIWHSLYGSMMEDGGRILRGVREAQNEQVKMLWAVSQGQAQAWTNLYGAAMEQGERFSRAAFAMKLDESRMLWRMGQANTQAYANLHGAMTEQAQIFSRAAMQISHDTARSLWMYQEGMNRHMYYMSQAFAAPWEIIGTAAGRLLRNMFQAARENARNQNPVPRHIANQCEHYLIESENGRTPDSLSLYDSLGPYIQRVSKLKNETPRCILERCTHIIKMLHHSPVAIYAKRAAAVLNQPELETELLEYSASCD